MSLAGCLQAHDAAVPSPRPCTMFSTLAIRALEPARETAWSDSGSGHRSRIPLRRQSVAPIARESDRVFTYSCARRDSSSHPTEARSVAPTRVTAGRLSVPRDAHPQLSHVVVSVVLESRAISYVAVSFEMARPRGLHPRSSSRASPMPARLKRSTACARLVWPADCLMTCANPGRFSYSRPQIDHARYFQRTLNAPNHDRPALGPDVGDCPPAADSRERRIDRSRRRA